MTKLNLLLQLQQQKLLAENKERAGFNRSAKEDRSRTTKTADKASNPPATSPAAQAQQAEDARKKKELSGGSLDLHKRRRPAATGDKKKLRVFGISNINSYDWPEKIENVVIPWTATYNRRIESSIEPNGTRHYRWIRETQQQTNSYQVVEREWIIGFNEDFGNSTTLFATPKHTVPGVITAFNWYFHQSSIGVTEQSVAGAVYHGEESIIASTPQLTPHSSSWFTNKQTMTTNDKPLTSSDGRYIYHSTWYVAGSPPPSFYRISSKDIFYGYTIFNPLTTTSGLPYQIIKDELPLEQIDIGGSIFFGRYIQKDIWDIQQGTSKYYNLGDSLQSFRDVRGLYWRYDTQTPDAVPELTVKDLSYPGDGTAADRRNVLSNFLDNLNPSDPYYKLWKFLYAPQYLSLPTIPGYSNYSKAYDFLNYLLQPPQQQNTYLRWPPNLVYYPDTGEALFTKALNTGAPTVYSTTVATGLETYQMMNLFPYLTQADNSHQIMLSNGWEVEDVDTSSTVFLDPNFRVAHRAT